MSTRVESERRTSFTPLRVRGGVSLWSVLTGVVVAFGALFLLSAIVGGILAATGVDAQEEVAAGTREAGLGAGIALVIAVFLAYMWGGYTAGRMGRGAGFANGLLVPILALIVAAVIAGIVAALGADADLNISLSEWRLPVSENELVDFGRVIGIAALVAMFLGGIAGGMAGSGWHRKLERRAIDEEREAAAERAPVDDRRPAQTDADARTRETPAVRDERETTTTHRPRT
jgi:MFS family permease